MSNRAAIVTDISGEFAYDAQAVDARMREVGLPDELVQQLPVAAARRSLED